MRAGRTHLPWVRPPLPAGRRLRERMGGQYALADQAAQCFGERWHIQPQTKSTQRPEGRRQVAEHVAVSQQCQHRPLPVIQQGQRARLLDEQPEARRRIGRRARQQCERAGGGLVRPDAAPIEQPEIDERPEQGAAIAAGQALFQTLDRGNEHGHGAALVGDEMELVQSILVAAQGEPGEKLLDRGVPRPDR